MTDLSAVSKRAKLAPRREPYWQKISARAYLGYRRTRSGGTWVARHYDGYGQVYHSIGDLTGMQPYAQYDTALARARDWLDHIAAGGSTEPITVADACRRYIDRGASADQAARLERLVLAHPIRHNLLVKLTRGDVLAWRKDVEAMPALVTRTKAGQQRTKPRSSATINRDMVPLRAALNLALDNGYVLSAVAWRQALKPIKSADRRRGLYLDREQRRALIANLPDDAAAFVRGLCHLPLRPGALAALCVRDFDVRKHELRVLTDKAGEDRHILLPPTTSALLSEMARVKLPAAPLFAQAGGGHWHKDAWKKPIKAAAAAAGLPAAVTAYTLRHSTITDLVTGGLDLLTVAQISGTSAAMIERHYGHLQKQRAADALATLAI